MGDRRKCQTYAASPAEPGGLPVMLDLLLEAGAIRECEEHGWMRDRSDPHARERALVAARREPPPNVPAEEAAAAVRNVLDTIGDTCPECPPEE